MSKLPLEFHRDKRGVAKAVPSGHDHSFQLLAQFFEAELGGDAAYCERLQAAAKDHIHGDGKAWRTSGNSFAVEVEGKKVSLRPLFGADQNRVCTVDLPDFLALLREWHALLT